MYYRLDFKDFPFQYKIIKFLKKLLKNLKLPKINYY